MIDSLQITRSTNDGTTKQIEALAHEDGTGGTETFAWQICAQSKTTTETFTANQKKVIQVTHTASGVCVVSVKATSHASTASDKRTLNVDKNPEDLG